jgi:hypothetical protein
MMFDDGPARRSLPILAAGLLLALSAASGASADEWEKIRESYGSALKANAKRIGEITAKERGVPEPQRAEKITRDKIASVRTNLKSAGKAKSLADAAEKASAAGAGALADLAREQGDYLAVVGSEWGADGAERKKLREAMAAAQKNLERANANLTKAARTGADVSMSGALEKATQIDAMVTEAGDRLRAKWQLEQAARERDMKQREREAGERARSTPR